MFIRKTIIAVCLFIFISISNSYSCTTAIISGKATKNGRPILWKHRDSNAYQNKLSYFKQGKLKFIGLVNSTDTLNNQIWAGTNSAGFCIMNSASYNLKEKKDTTINMDREGIFMKEALSQCTSVEDFEKFLKNYPKPIGVEANFGVIDSEGNGAYFETGNYNYTKFDVNDPKIAPNGYLIRTNFSETGRENSGYGYIRYANAEHLFKEHAKDEKFNVSFILNNLTRSLYHSLKEKDIAKDIPLSNDKVKMISFQDYIPRYNSVSSVIFEGVKTGENAEFTTMWTILGFQFCSVAVPVWVKAEDKLPQILFNKENKNALLCEMALKLKEKCFPIKRGSGKKYLNFSAVYNQNGTGIYQKLIHLEKEIVKLTRQKQIKWHKNNFSEKEIETFYKQIDKLVIDYYKNKFDLK